MEFGKWSTSLRYQRTGLRVDEYVRTQAVHDLVDTGKCRPDGSSGRHQTPSGLNCSVQLFEGQSAKPLKKQVPGLKLQHVLAKTPQREGIAAANRVLEADQRCGGPEVPGRDADLHDGEAVFRRDLTEGLLTFLFPSGNSAWPRLSGRVPVTGAPSHKRQNQQSRSPLHEALR